MTSGAGETRKIKVCYGPRCGTRPNRREIYAALNALTDVEVCPVMCQGVCGKGITIVLPTGEKRGIENLEKVII